MPIFGNSLRGTLGYLPADLIEQLVLRRERDRSLRLDLQQHLTGMRCSVDHQIVKRKALIYALVTNPLDGRSGQPARLETGEEGQQVERTMRACRAEERRGGKRRGRTWRSGGWRTH